MELRQYFAVIRRSAWILALGALLAGIIGFGVSRVITPIFRVSTTLLIDEARSAGPADYTSILKSERLAKTYSELIKKPSLIESVAANLGLNLKPEELAKGLTVQTVRDTQLIVLNVENPDPVLAARIANEVPKVFLKQIDQIQSSRFAASKNNLLTQLEKVNEQISASQGQLAELKTSSDPKAESERLRIDNELVELRRKAASLSQTFDEVLLAEARSVTNVIVAQPATVPDKPVWPNTLLLTAVALILGLGSTASVLYVLEYVDDTVKNSDEIQQLLELPALGTIVRSNVAATASSPLLSISRPNSPVSEALRTLRTNIQFASVGKSIKSILVTSPNPADGKTTVASNLAVVMAQAGLSVLLIDADLRRPSLHRVFGLLNQSGLSNLLAQNVPFESQNLHSTSLEKLKVLTSGPTPPNPSELLGAQGMEHVLKAFEETFDIVIVDSPPALVVTDAAVLARQVNGVLIVLQAGKTRRGAAVKVKQNLLQGGAILLGVVLNKLSPQTGGDYYDNYYYAGHESKHKTDTIQSKPSRRHTQNWVPRKTRRVKKKGNLSRVQSRKGTVLGLGLVVGATAAASLSAIFLGRSSMDEVIITEARPMVTFHTPLDGAVVPINEAVPVDLSIVDGVGVIRVELWVNGERVVVEQPAAKNVKVFEPQLHWKPTQPGSYKIEVRAFNRNNATNVPVSVVVTAQGEAALVLTPTPTATSSSTPTNSPTATSSPTPTDSPTAIRTATPVTSSTPTPTTVPPTATSTPIVPFLAGVLMIRVSPDASSTCPTTFNFSADIGVSRDGQVTYVWERSDGVSAPTQAITFTSAISQPVTHTWDLDTTGTYWARLRIISPTAVSSTQNKVTLICPEGFAGAWIDNFGTMILAQDGNRVAGTFYDAIANKSGTITGSTTGNTVDGRWAAYDTSGTVQWTLAENGRTFTGTANGSGKWCGARVGAEFPSGCSFAGSWIVKLNISQGSMSLVQNGTSVIGTYFNGSLKGTVSYEQGLTLLSGTWFANNESGPLKFYLGSANGLQFQGNYNGSVEWCGWRSNSTQPKTCLRR